MPTLRWVKRDLHAGAGAGGASAGDKRPLKEENAAAATAVTSVAEVNDKSVSKRKKSVTKKQKLVEFNESEKKKSPAWKAKKAKKHAKHGTPNTRKHARVYFKPAFKAIASDSQFEGLVTVQKKEPLCVCR